MLAFKWSIGVERIGAISKSNLVLLQTVIAQMEDYCRRAQPHERDVFQRYVNKCAYFYVVTLSIMGIAFVGSILEPLFRGLDSYPLVIKYPFVVDQWLSRTIVYLHQAFGLYQVFCQATANVFLALLLWFTSARFEILSIKFRKASEYFDWQVCVREHQELLRYVDLLITIEYPSIVNINVSS